jgi:hypothetical protein
MKYIEEFKSPINQQFPYEERRDKDGMDALF